MSRRKSSRIPAFLRKLWIFVNDTKCDDLIAWSDSGDSFIIKDQSRFANELLPQYFSHKNMPSFLKQLSNYSFKKVADDEKSGLQNKNDEMEFRHELNFFIKEEKGLMELIEKKIPKPRVPDPPSNTNAKDILRDSTSNDRERESMYSLILKMNKEMGHVSKELSAMRQKQKVQEKLLQLLIQFFVPLMQKSGNSNMNVRTQRKIKRMIHDSCKTSSPQHSRTTDVLQNKNSECLTIGSPLGPVINEVTDNVPDKVNLHPVSISKSSAVIHVAESPAIQDEMDSSSKSKHPFVRTSRISDGNNLNLPVKQLGILKPLQQRSPAASRDENNQNESILGIPLEYVTHQGSTKVGNVISMPGDSTMCNVISINEDDVFGNVISLPEGSVINNIIPISKLCDVADKEVITSNQVTPLANPNGSMFIGSEFFNSPDPAALSELQPSTSNGNNSQKFQLTLSKNNFDNSLLLASLQTSKIVTPDEDLCNSTREANTEFIKKGEISKVSTTHDERNYHLATAESSNLVKNALTNHLLSVDENLNYAQDQLAASNWNFDGQNLFGLFNSDGLAICDPFSSSLSDDMCIKAEMNRIMGHEIIPFTPNMLKMNLFPSEAPNHQAEGSSSDFNYQSETAIDILKENVASEAANFLTNQALPDHTSPKRKKCSSRRPKNKQRKAE